jgi:hypothetical protein
MNLNGNKVPESSLVLTITPEKEYTAITIRERPGTPPTTIKVKEYVQKISKEESDEKDQQLPRWKKEVTEITGSDVSGNNFKIKVSAMNIDGVGSRIWAMLYWKKNS